MSSFHTKLRAFAVCKREAVQDMHTREFFSDHYAPEHAVARQARLLRRQSARHKHIAKHFGKRWAHMLRYDCVYITPESQAPRCAECGIQHTPLTPEERANFPDHPTLIGPGGSIE